MARPKGSRNKPKRALLALLQEQFPDYHPVIEMAKIATEKDGSGEFVNDTNIRLNANKEVAQYCVPKLKALEVTGADDGPLQIEVVKFTG